MTPKPYFIFLEDRGPRAGRYECRSFKRYIPPADTVAWADTYTEGLEIVRQLNAERPQQPPTDPDLFTP